MYHALVRFEPRASFSTWLYRIAVNHSLNVIRSKKRRSWLQFFSRLKTDGADIGLLADFSTNPHRILENEEKAAAVHKALNRLHENQRAVVILHRFEGLSYKEIAKILNTSVSSVESRLFRARQKLAKMLKSSLD